MSDKFLFDPEGEEGSHFDLIPAGDYEAEIIAAGHSWAAESAATPGVGNTPTSRTSTPSLARPAASAACSKGPDARVSRPMKNDLGLAAPGASGP